MGEIKRYYLHKRFLRNDIIHDKICHRWLKGEEIAEHLNDLNNTKSLLKKKNEQLKQLAEGNEEQLLKVMSYLHDNHYKLWEIVNKECFDD